ncbi:MAG: bifunctional DNA-formamidopyrimidine glycosylase/DNA-(apurinic or apyrimidinic site) lyase [Proteobacteria bacterium]|nr:bifunctional DNA-formamidopyrimidine glycosylase/DNA-(apurinic or apyrimidinic site) lyase [Pseudomonadota bacterium]
MPELPEVETVRRGLAPVVEGHLITRVRVRRADLRRPLPEDFAERIEGRRVLSCGRRGKYLLIHLDDGQVLMIHLGMSGRIMIFRDHPPPLDPHDHVIFETGGGTTIRFNDKRRFGLMALARAESLESHPLLAGLGPEPLGNAFDGPVLAERLKHRRAPLKSALMDQSVVAGLGNIYVCESLYRAGLSPRRKARTVGPVRARRLAAAIRQVLGEAIEAGGSTLRDHRLPSGELGYFQHAFAVYGRDGEPCPHCACGGTIRRIVQSGRSTFYCPMRQR